jgi:hypothetical protein
MAKLMLFPELPWLLLTVHYSYLNLTLVCGVVALALAEGEFDTVKEVHDYIKSVSSKDKIQGSLKGAPNSFLYNKVFEVYICLRFFIYVYIGRVS